MGESEIVYVEEGWIKELDLTIRETFVLKSLDPNRAEVTLDIHWPDSKNLPRDVKTTLLQRHREKVRGLKHFCELPSHTGSP